MTTVENRTLSEQLRGAEAVRIFTHRRSRHGGDTALAEGEMVPSSGTSYGATRQARRARGTARAL
jgi:hypothetical protein